MCKTVAIGPTATTPVERSAVGVSAYVPGVSDWVEIRLDAEGFLAPKE